MELTKKTAAMVATTTVVATIGRYYHLLNWNLKRTGQRI